MPRLRGNLHWNLTLVLIIVLGTVTLGLDLFGAARNIPAIYPHARPIDFGAYYTAAVMLNRGQALAIYDLETEEQVAQELGLPGVGGGYLYPPFFAVLLQPLALLDFESAARIWFGVNFLALLLSTYFLLRIARIDTGARNLCIAFALVLIFPPAVADLVFGQVNILLLLLLTGGVYLLDSHPVPSRQVILAGLLIGLASAVKFFPALVLLPVAAARQWRVVWGLLLAGVLVLAIGAVSDSGLENTARYFALRGPKVGVPADPFNQSHNAALQRLFEPGLIRFSVFDLNNYVEVQGVPLISAPMLVVPISILFILTVALVSLVALWRTTARGLPLRVLVSLFLMLGLLVVPILWEYYGVLVLIPFAVWLSFQERRATSFLVLIVVAFLLTLQRYWRVMAVSGVPLWLLSFGLLAILICWGYTLYLCYVRTATVPGSTGSIDAA